MAKQTKTQNVAVLAIFLFVAVMAIGEFGGLFSIYYDTTATTLNVGDKVYFRPQVFDEGGFQGSSQYHNEPAEKATYDKLASGIKCYAQQKTVSDTKTGDGWGGKWAFRTTPTTSAAGKYYELEAGTLYFTRLNPNTNVYSMIFTVCDDNPMQYLGEMDWSKKYNFVSSGGSTQICNPTDCAAKNTNVCEGALLKQNVYGCIDGTTCVARSSTSAPNAECATKYWTPICSANGKTWNGDSCVTPTPTTPPVDTTPTLPSAAETACKIGGGTWENNINECIEAIDIADGDGAETGTNAGADNGDIGRSEGNLGITTDFLSENKYYIAGGIMLLFAWASGLMVYLSKR